MRKKQGKVVAFYLSEDLVHALDKLMVNRSKFAERAFRDFLKKIKLDVSGL